MKIYNSLTKQKEEFIPIDKGHVRLYFCGPTVYNQLHIGNYRAALVADLLSKTVKGIFPKVSYVSNITDIDDKIIKAASDQDCSITDITQKYYKKFMEDAALLGIAKPDIQPFATDYVDEMIDYIQQLITNGTAYEINGNVLFDVSKFNNYGCLSDRCIEDQDSGSRIKVEEYKKNPNDFILWKPSSESEPGWDSPWGTGRPGWHLECSVMSESSLGVPFDIHGGGNDLKFPHHDNEIAQTCGFHNNSDPTCFAKYWVHNGFLNLADEKMSKSLGNVVYIDDLIKDYKGNDIRLALLSTHYRQPIPWSTNVLNQAVSIAKKIKRFTSSYSNMNKFFADTKIGEAILDDLNTPKALAVMQEIINTPENFELEKEISTYKYIFEGSSQDLSISKADEDKINHLIELRLEAKNNGDYQTADNIRDELSKMNVTIKDIGGKTEWEIL
jgi:cysteinyl-tRNA synthetase|tara:strand:+ start:3104 stop:4432 length:1329 start_codon:yes stop_codon:yes gene_type:complete